MPCSLKCRLILLLVIVALPGILVIYQHARAERESIIEQISQQARQYTHQIALRQRDIIHDVRNYLEQLSHQPAVQRPASQACSDFLASILKLDTTFINLGVPDANGELRCNALPISERINVADRKYIQTAIRQQRFSMSSLLYDRATHTTSVNFAYPVYSPDSHEVAGTAVAVVSLNWWSSQLATLELPPGSIAIITDMNDSVVAAYPPDEEVLGQSARQFGFQGMAPDFQDLTTERVTDNRNIQRLFAHARLYEPPNSKPVTISIGLPIDAAIAQAQAHFIDLLLLYGLVMVLLALIVTRGVTVSVLQPLARLTEATRQFEHGHINFRQTPNGVTELRALEQRFLNMATTRLQAEQTIHQHHEELTAVFNSLPDLYFRVDNHGKILDYRGAPETELYLSPSEFLQRSITNLMPDNIHQSFKQHLARHLQTGKITHWQYQLRIGQRLRSYEARLNRIQGTEHFAIVIRDITQQKEADELIWHQAHFDSLTQLPNRSMLYDQLVKEVRRSKRKHRTLAVLFIDLDHFKEVNDSLGHDLGDQLLIEAAQRLRTCLRKEDTLARQGGDEFTLLLPDLERLSSVENISQRILTSIAQPFQLGEQRAYVTASIGIALYPDDAQTPEELLRAADQAMYAAKANGKNCHHYFTAAMQQQAVRRVRILNDLHNALDAEQFLLHYQPVVDLEHGKVIKLEALIRWQHPQSGLISPGVFIPLAEETRLIHGIGHWVFQQALRDLPRIQKHFGAHIQISFNVSPVQFSGPDNPLSFWSETLRQQNIDGSNLIVEITEGVMMESSEQIRQQLAELQRAGLQLALDDFGTGFSSLSYIHQYQIDFLKIDRSFVANLTPESDAYALCQAITVMAQKLGIRVIAEGIETQPQAALLRQIHCDFGQGFGFAKPMPLHQLLALPNYLNEPEADNNVLSRV